MSITAFTTISKVFSLYFSTTICWTVRRLSIPKDVWFSLGYETNVYGIERFPVNLQTKFAGYDFSIKIHGSRSVPSENEGMITSIKSLEIKRYYYNGKLKKSKIKSKPDCVLFAFLQLSSSQFLLKLYFI